MATPLAAECCRHASLLPGGATLDPLLLLGTGLTMSLGHCLGMCGPLLAAVASASPAASAWRRLGRLLVYHGGRILVYGVIGLAGGLLGAAALRAGGGTPRWTGAVSLVLGVAMLALALGLLGLWPGARRLESGRLGRRVTGWMARLLATRRANGPLLLGVANGLLPCGPVYAVALGTPAAGRPWHGAAAMLLYGLGTLPVLLAFGLGAGRLAPVVQARFTRAGAVLVALIGLQLGLRGAAAWGWVGHLAIGRVVLW